MLRCSIIINIVVLVYICSQLVYRDNSLQLPPSAAYLQQSNGGGGDQTGGRRQLSLEPDSNVLINSVNSNSVLPSNLISANGIGASNSDNAQVVSGGAIGQHRHRMTVTVTRSFPLLLHRIMEESQGQQQGRTTITGTTMWVVY